MNFYWIYAIIGALLLGMLLFNSSGGSDSISYNEFVEKAKNGEIKKMKENGDVAHIFLTKEAKADTSNADKKPAMHFGA
ncbi:MAG: ATP-dependent metallopeptidase FtsH/Yme1/Tma family protein, partial [Flavobacteriales bacterium]|nr:ATP-dependent metallopeptidase FtsH/Yme1/Tma family protein [Flavobacteriales bacterium]